ncbi:4'-phosphopantetheinyl transferase superfamily protein [Agromyces sp. Soil535]|uniref:4'-phosphopantetheinyl transferase family protein n=1 Tax=Agromyces sp. Soil535 TaxID=1736390 RepID=UPI0006FD4D4E|nr:hypothetical protein [Agromyces sp. Soil535]KRE31301.1 hypothetical protein ASG80_02295 [Agromyces sp. Soil535]
MSAGAAIDGGVRLAWADPAEFDRARALHLLDGPERARAADTADPAARDRFLLGRMLLRDLAARLGAVRPEEVVVVARCERCGGDHGRPRVHWPDASGSPPSVSLASCSALVIAALAPSGIAVGVDVERPRAARSREAETDRRAAVVQLLGGSRRTAIRRWVRAEAVLKADGRGLRVEPASVVFGRDRAHVPDRPARYRLTDLRIDGCLVSVALARPPVRL